MLLTSRRTQAGLFAIRLLSGKTRPIEPRNLCPQLSNTPTLETVRAGLHWSFRMSKQIEPWLFTLGWYTLVWKATFGGLNG